MGRWHVRGIDAAGGVIVAVVDSDLARARAVAGTAEALSSLDDLARLDPSPDVVHVCTPGPSHADVAEHALALGAHVIVEKPLTPDAESTRALLQSAASARRIAVPVHQFLFQPGVLRLSALQAELGTLVRCSFVAASAGAEIAGIEPDELVSEILPHPLSLFARLLPGALDGADWCVLRPARGELRALAATGGTSLEIAISSRGRPTRTELSLVGDRASAIADLFHGFSVVERGAPTRAGKLARPFVVSSRTLARAAANLGTRAARRETAYPGLRELIRRTNEAIAGGNTAPISAAETLAVAEARDAILTG